MSYQFHMRRPRTTQERRHNQDKNHGYHRPGRSAKRLPNSYDDLWVSHRLYKSWKKQYKITPAYSRDSKHRRTHQHHVRCMGCGITIRRFIVSKSKRRGLEYAVATNQGQHCL